MAKLQMLTDSSLEGDNGDPLTHLTKLFKETKETDEGQLYQHIKLLNFQIEKQSVGTAYKEMITTLAVIMEDRFQSLFKSHIFENLIEIVDMCSSTTGENVLSTCCDEEILLVVKHYESYFLKTVVT